MQVSDHVTAAVMAELLGWLCVIAGLALYGVLVALDERRKTRPRAIAVAPAAPRRAPDSDWAVLCGILEQAAGRAPAISAFQNDAALQIDAAEHAFNRLIGECAPVMSLPVAPSLTPVRELAREPAPAEQPLAA